jgi:hypothetical protein
MEAFLESRAVVRPAEWRAHTLRADRPEARVSDRRRSEALDAAERAVRNAERPLDGRWLRRLPEVLRLGEMADAAFFDALARRPGVRNAGSFWWSELGESWRRLAASVENRVRENALLLGEASRPERDAARWLVATGRLVEVDPATLWPRDQYDALVARVRDAFQKSSGRLTLAELREGLAWSRREAVRFLELLDRRGVTVRLGEHRALAPGDVTSCCCDRAPSPD